ncbi:hypothetical protein L3X38_019378 [Prunus dulcis]|uniref:Uncharacterized protein n=1 Tax=Prunus dulcis TaxID=3755 RepID=A0AAD4ZBZ5_PRUDU|nr:hypothetical protein L3X38_019378 [Prunus dulcis]
MTVFKTFGLRTPDCVEKLASHPFLLSSEERMGMFARYVRKWEKVATHTAVKKALQLSDFDRFKSWNSTEVLGSMDNFIKKSYDSHYGNYSGEVVDLLSFLRNLNNHYHQLKAFSVNVVDVDRGVQKLFPGFLELLLRDFSSNRSEGEIPAALKRDPNNLAQLIFLEYFNVSYNHLWGPIPLGQQFGTFLEDSYEGNSGLCGKPLSKKCDSSISLPPSIFEEDDDSGFQIALDWYVVLPGVVTGLIVGAVAGNFWTSKNHEWFLEKFSRKRQPRGTRGRRRHRN